LPHKMAMKPAKNQIHSSQVTSNHFWIPSAHTCQWSFSFIFQLPATGSRSCCLGTGCRIAWRWAPHSRRKALLRWSCTQHLAGEVSHGKRST
jgi:hypothetical protein